MKTLKSTIKAATLGTSISSNPYNYGDMFSNSWTTSYDSALLNKEDKEELLKSLLDSEEDLMPILKQYLVGYLDKIMENPELIIKDLIKEKDSKIIELEKKISELEKKLDTMIQWPSAPLPYPYTYPWGNNDVICTYNTTTTSTV